MVRSALLAAATVAAGSFRTGPLPARAPASGVAATPPPLLAAAAPTRPAGPSPVGHGPEDFASVLGEAARDEAMMRRFVEDFHAVLMRERPDLFRAKMLKAAASGLAFYRAFPQLFYEDLKRAPEAADLAAAKPALLAGDLHAENLELVPLGRARIPQPNDFDDAGVAPVSLEIARLLGSAGTLAEGGEERAELIGQAARAYATSVSETFSDWAGRVQDEKSVRGAKEVDYDWAGRAGAPLADAALAARLLKAAGLDADEWTVHDRAGAGLSSIGQRRYLFLGKTRGHVFELKELRDSALLFFTGEPAPGSNRPRVDAAAERLREVPVETRTLAFEGREWSLRRREAVRAVLVLDRSKSSARALGGLGAQLHRRGASEGELREALRLVTPELVERSLDFMSRMRGALAALIKSGVWGFSER